MAQKPQEERPRATGGELLQSDAKLKALTEKLQKLYGDKEVKASIEQMKALKPGITARGAIANEEKDGSSLDLDTNPCTGKIATFHKPYLKRDAGEGTCKNGKKYPRTEVEQK